MSEDVLDFQRIKKEVTIARVLAHYGVVLRASGEEMRGHCPLPTHTSRDSRNSFSVNMARNVWCCQSASCMGTRAGHLGGTVLDLVANLERCSIRQAAVRLKEWFGRMEDNTVIPEQIVTSPDPNLPLRFQLTNLDHTHAYLGARGITPTTARNWGIGYYAGPGIMQGRVVIPIHNQVHELVGYAGRAVDGEEPKYRFPAGFHKSQELFHLHRARYAAQGTAIVVEGFFDVIKVRQAGYRNVVALMGSSLSEAQAGLLAKHFRRVVLLLDGDAAGQRAATIIAARLSSSMEVSTIRVPEGKQPDQMDSKQINELVSGQIRTARGCER